MAEQGLRVSVINPNQIKAFGSSRLVRTKTDKVDAQLIADFCCGHQPEAWQAPSPSEQALRAMVLRLDALQAIRTQETNRLEVVRPAVTAGIENHISWLDTEIKSLIKLISKHIDDDPDLKNNRELLDSVPGLGKRAIATLLSFYGNLSRFANSRQAVAFAGLDHVSMNLATASGASHACQK